MINLAAQLSVFDCRIKLNDAFRYFFDYHIVDFDELTLTEKKCSLQLSYTINDKVEILALVMLFDKYETVLVQSFGFSVSFINEINNILKSQKVDDYED